MSWQAAKQEMAFENEKEEAMQNQEQDLKEFFRTIFTLRNGIQIEILTKKFYMEEAEIVKGEKSTISSEFIVIEGFITTPMVVEKKIKVDCEEIIATEVTKEPHITWRNTELDVRTQSCNHPPGMSCELCVPEFEGQGG